MIALLLAAALVCPSPAATGGNLIAIYAHVKAKTQSAITIAPLNEQLQPLTTLAPNELGVLPASATFDASTRVTNEDRAATPAALRVGETVKVYGCKLPSSPVIRAFRIEIFTPTR